MCECRAAAQKRQGYINPRGPVCSNSMALSAAQSKSTTAQCKLGSGGGKGWQSCCVVSCSNVDRKDSKLGVGLSLVPLPLHVWTMRTGGVCRQRPGAPRTAGQQCGRPRAIGGRRQLNPASPQTACERRSAVQGRVTISVGTRARARSDRSSQARALPGCQGQMRVVHGD